MMHSDEYPFMCFIVGELRVKSAIIVAYNHKERDY